MDDNQFFKKVCEMRDAQKNYFDTRSKIYLDKSKVLEKEIDAEIKRRTQDAIAEFDKRQQTLNFDGDQE